MTARPMHVLAAASLALFAALFASPARTQATGYEIVGDGIPMSLTGTPGDARRGKALLVRREQANCLQCHSIGQKELAGGGSKGPSLDGVGSALTAAQLRLSVVDLSRVTRHTEMPSFHKSGATGQKLTAQEVEDIVAFLVTLRN